MSGVQCGSRLERLELLRRQLEHEITVERRRVALEQPQRQRPAVPAPRKRGNTVDQILAAAGVTALEVKVWAVEAGILDAIRRGRVGLAVVDAYIAAHDDVVDELVSA